MSALDLAALRDALAHATDPEHRRELADAIDREEDGGSHALHLVAALGRASELRALLTALAAAVDCESWHEAPAVAAETRARAVAAEAEVARRRALLAGVAEVAFLPCDQTVQCAGCGAVWWSRPEAIEENWHAEGCPVFAAQLAGGVGVDVRRGPAPERCSPWADPANETTAKAIRAEVDAARQAPQWRSTPPTRAEFDATPEATEGRHARLILTRSTDQPEPRLGYFVWLNDHGLCALDTYGDEYPVSGWEGLGYEYALCTPLGVPLLWPPAPEGGPR
ncbi:MAG: hypothetical protein Q8S73_38520 [Deltaproteobacteria bacterium]|nr:hypothetical protein [Myxococcales bacterium]MDP3220059.1 hypothetical protein [Deltaproteobacteria bacterium]